MIDSRLGTVKSSPATSVIRVRTGAPKMTIPRTKAKLLNLLRSTGVLWLFALAEMEAWANRRPIKALIGR